MNDFFPDQWWRTYDNVVLLTGWLAEQGFDAKAVAYAVEKPWKYEAEFYAAKYELDDGDVAQAMEEYEESDGEITVEDWIKNFAAEKVREQS